MRPTDEIFIDSGAWIALALSRDSLHERARVSWERIEKAGPRLATSVPVILETFTFLERNTAREVALQWKNSMSTLRRLRVLECTRKDLEKAWAWFERRELHRLSAVDATSFVLMARERIRMAFAFDHHFASAGFKLVD